ncbi:hypothetical protein VCUG_01817 [Vavraia culicis subsp. floridensis]|uniref:Uncharacterized protein n=1 Tax=Vavraia culicis (isolate floridensis) TaxID=948595 RepID=L2GTF7_VAVCU|nr:uncharacterized protein VCUG_01817 [Vavraia culicis subsp. floridensis]ELA46667.1 hypothetical protein VCUG_01817 [Vavraia culicis subsp. floridensis]
MFEMYFSVLSLHYISYLNASQNPVSDLLGVYQTMNYYKQRVEDHAKMVIAKDSDAIRPDDEREMPCRKNTCTNVLGEDNREVNRSAHKVGYTGQETCLERTCKDQQPSTSSYVDHKSELFREEEHSPESKISLGKNLSKKTDIPTIAGNACKYLQGRKTHFRKKPYEGCNETSGEKIEENNHNISDMMYNMNDSCESRRMTGLRFRNWSSKLALPMRIYYSILNTMWHVSYGKYIDDTSSKSSFHLQYDNMLCFLNTSISHSPNEHLLAKHVLDSIKILCQKHNSYYKSKHNDDCYGVEHQTTHDPTITTRWHGSCSAMSHPDIINTRNINQEHVVSYLNICQALKKTQSDDMMFYLTKLQDDAELIKDITNLCYTKVMPLLIQNVNVFFRIIGINSSTFRTLNRLDIKTIIYNQLSIFFCSNLSVKLLLFPELLSLRQYFYDITAGKRYDNTHKLYIGYYVMRKFELLVQLFMNIIGRKGLDRKDLRDHDILFYQLYTREFFLVYVFHNVLSMSYSDIIRYVSLCRLQFLLFFKFTDHGNYENEGNFIEFLPLNFLDVSPVFNIKSFIQCEGNILDSTITTEVRQIPNQVVSKYFIDQTTVPRELLRRFLESVRVIMPSFECCDVFFNMVWNDANDVNFNWHSHATISNWVTRVRLLPIHSYLSSRS